MGLRVFDTSPRRRERTRSSAPRLPAAKLRARAAVVPFAVALLAVARPRSGAALHDVRVFRRGL